LGVYITYNEFVPDLQPQQILQSNTHHPLHYWLVCLIIGLITFTLGYLFHQLPQNVPLQTTPQLITPSPKPVPPKAISITLIPDIANLLPPGIFVRDIEMIEGLFKATYIVLYLDPGYTMDPDPYALSCPSEILGEPLIGNYHIALIQSGQLINTLNIPTAYSSGLLSLAYRNLPILSDATGTDVEDRLQVVKLIALKDYTGDGKPYEFLFTTTGGGCGFYDSILIGYHQLSNTLKFYSTWLPRFNPDNSGKSHFLFECGDHGNDTRVEKTYQFNPKTSQFVITQEKLTPCSP